MVPLPQRSFYKESVMEPYRMNSDATLSSAYQTAERVAIFLRAVYGWMCAGLAITAFTAMFIASSPSLVMTIARNQFLFWGIVIAQFGIVIALSARVQKMAASTASMLFVAYSA